MAMKRIGIAHFAVPGALVCGALTAVACASKNVTPATLDDAGGTMVGPDGATYLDGGATFVPPNPGGGPGGGTPQPAPPSQQPSGGPVYAAGFQAADAAKLGGTPVAGAKPTVAYPLRHSLFPANMAPVEIHLTKGAASQSLALIHFQVAEMGGFDLQLYETCAPVATNPALNGCVLQIPPDIAKKLGDANYFGKLTTTIRLADTSGGNLGETVLDDVSWTYSTLTGGLYYWTTINPTGTATNKLTAIKRYDFSMANQAPQVYWKQSQSPMVLPNNDPHACIGCHVLSSDGSKLGLTLGGSVPAGYQLIDVASQMVLAQRITPAGGQPGPQYATFSTLSPNASRLISAYNGILTLHQADATLMDVNALFNDVMESKSEPFWSPFGDKIAFVSYSIIPPDGKNTGDRVKEAQIWIAPADGNGPTGPGKLIVPRVPGTTSYYPAINDDSSFVVFNQSTCNNAGPAVTGAPGWGLDKCDGYDDPSARVFVVSSGGGNAVELANANGDPSQFWTNSWPRWSPDHGSFGGKTIYWVAFSTRRPYGLALNQGSPITPQLWFTAVQLTPGQAPTVDPSFAPVWLPGQNDDITQPTGNHTPQWVKRAVPILIK